jgi:hypothetical protein
MSGETPELPDEEEQDGKESEASPALERYVHVSQTAQVGAGHVTLIGHGTGYVFHGT